MFIVSCISLGLLSASWFGSIQILCDHIRYIGIRGWRKRDRKRDGYGQYCVGRMVMIKCIDLHAVALSNISTVQGNTCPAT